MYILLAEMLLILNDIDWFNSISFSMYTGLWEKFPFPAYAFKAMDQPYHVTKFL